VLVSAVALQLAACATHTLRQPLADFRPTDVQIEQLQRWSAWQARGRLAVKTAKEGFNAHFNWRQAGDATDLVVEGPFGAGHSRVLANAGHVRIEAGSQAPLEFAAPFDGVESALAERVGFGLPLGSLAYWMRGVPDPTSGADRDIPADPAAGASSGAPFAQAGWRILPEDPVSVERAPATLPRRITLTQGDVRIRVVIDQWSAEP
jgi:outer membrane lipoprotein LolB